MNRVYWDSLLFIYLLEANQAYGPRVRQLHQAIQRRGDKLCTGVFTVGEVLTGPQKRNDVPGVNALKRFFAGDAIEILPFNLQAAEQYSLIRAKQRVSQADAMHLAIAAAAGTDLFITNDDEVKKLSVPGIRFFADVDGKVI